MGLKLWRQIWKWQRVLIIAPMAAGLILAASSTGLFQLIEWVTLDQFFRLRPLEPPDPRIVIVTIDESDINQIGKWPIPDEVLAKLLNNIKGQQPKAIGIDLYRNLPVEPGYQALLEVFKSTPNLIGVEKVAGEPIAPSPILSKQDQVGMADLVLDADGKVRRGLISSKPQGKPTKLNLGVKLALMYLETEGITLKSVDATKKHLRLGKALFVPFKENDGGYVDADSGGYQILLNFRGPKQNFYTVSLKQILENRIPPNLLHNRIVLIGTTAQSLNDLFLTPYSSKITGRLERTPGVVIHANLTSQILSAAKEGRLLIQVWAEPIEWLWVLVWSFTGATVCFTFLQTNLLQNKIYSEWIILGICIVAGGGSLLAISYIAFLCGWWIPVVSPVLALTSSAIAIALYHSLELQREKTDLEILLETTTAHFDTVEADLQDQAEEAARESERKLAQFLEAVSVGVAVIDATGKPYFANQRAQEILGKGVEPEAKPEQLAEVYQNYIAGTNQLYPTEKLPIVRALKGERASTDDIEIHQGDKVIPIEAWATPIYDESGNISYALVAFQDITERKQAESERKALINQLYELNQANERFVPRQFLELLNKESIVDVQLGEAVQQKMSILFSDIRNFTTLSERSTLEENFKFINTYLSYMEPAITANQGFIDKYIGDAIMALFSGSADNAVKAGIAMLHRLAEYNQTRQKSTHPSIHIGIGINTGSLMLGTVGGQNRMDGTVIGDAVNLAARLEGLTKYYGVALLISHQTFGCLQQPWDYYIRFIDRVQVKGKSNMVSVFEVFDADSPEIREGKLVTKTSFETALFLYHQGKISEAAPLFQECLNLNPGDKVAQLYLGRCS